LKTSVSKGQITKKSTIMNSIKLSFVFVIFITMFAVKSFAQKNSYPFEVKISGSGKQAIIFIPGLTCSGEVWDATKAVYEKEYSCYVLTMAGFGGVKPQEKASFNNWETGIAKYIKEHKMDKPILIGHSIGGGLVMALASDYPELVSKIIVVDALPCIGAMGNPNFKPAEKVDNTEKINKIVNATKEEFYESQKSTTQQLVLNGSKQETVLNWSLQSDRKTIAVMFWDYTNVDLREKIANITCPALILLNPYFKFSKPSMEAQYKNLKNVNLQYAEKGSHFIMYDDTEWYDNQLKTFISK
jgi:pimeloyl-ACP methyl ester carboxylesterase